MKNRADEEKLFKQLQGAVGKNTAMQLSTYSVPCHCRNCGWSGQLEIPVGKLVVTQTCPRCGCQEITRNETLIAPYGPYFLANPGSTPIHEIRM